MKARVVQRVDAMAQRLEAPSSAPVGKLVVCKVMQMAVARMMAAMAMGVV